MGSGEKISRLKRIQKRKRDQIEWYKKRLWRDLFIINLLSTLAILYYLEEAYVWFGNALNFIIATFTLLLFISLSYYFYIKKIRERKKKELKHINNKLYKLMKLNHD